MLSFQRCAFVARLLTVRQANKPLEFVRYILAANDMHQSSLCSCPILHCMCASAYQAQKLGAGQCRPGASCTSQDLA